MHSNKQKFKKGKLGEQPKDRGTAEGHTTELVMDGHSQTGPEARAAGAPRGGLHSMQSPGRCDWDHPFLEKGGKTSSCAQQFVSLGLWATHGWMEGQTKETMRAVSELLCVGQCWAVLRVSSLLVLTAIP